MNNLIQNIGLKVLYGFGFGLGMGLSFKIIPIEKKFKRNNHNRTSLINKDNFEDKYYKSNNYPTNVKK